MTARIEGGGDRVRGQRPSLRAKRSNPFRRVKEEWIASSHPPSPEGRLRRTRVLLAMTFDGQQSAFSRRDAPEVCRKVSRLEIRGRGECRMRAAPAVPCAKWVKKTHTSIQVQRRQSDIPCAMALRLTSCSSRRPGSFATVVQRIKVLSAPGRADQTSANLTPASGCQNHTTSPYATAPFVSAPFDRSRTLASPPCITFHA
jgi:hypothetical protein